MQQYTINQRLFPGAVALAGILFTVAAGLGGADGLCLTEGCSLYQDVRFLGLSLWWWGAGGFALLALLSVTGKLKLAYYLAYVAIAVDCVFLLWMAVSMPCLNCLVAGLLFFSVFVSLSVLVRPHRTAALVVAVLWLTLFSPNIFAAGQELAGPWRIHGSRDAPVRVFFSPSCPSCRVALKGLLMGGEGNVGFYPVAEDEADVNRLASLRQELSQGGSFVRAFSASRDPATAPELGWLKSLSLRAGIFRNKMALSRMGADKIPVIVMYGVPKGFGASGLSGGGGTLDFSDKDGFSGCTQLGEGAQDCD